MIYAALEVLTLTVIGTVVVSSRTRHSGANGKREGGEMGNFLQRFIGGGEDHSGNERQAAAEPRRHTDPDGPGVPGTAKPIIREINEQMARIEARAADDAHYAGALIEIGQIRDKHLPKLIDSYRDLTDEAKSKIFQRTGKSASYALKDALGHMLDRLHQIGSEQAQEDVSTFESNLDFISRRYDGSGI